MVVIGVVTGMKKAPTYISNYDVVRNLILSPHIHPDKTIYVFYLPGILNCVIYIFALTGSTYAPKHIRHNYLVQEDGL